MQFTDTSAHKTLPYLMVSVKAIFIHENMHGWEHMCLDSFRSPRSIFKSLLINPNFLISMQIGH
jgi:hypothetical protein